MSRKDFIALAQAIANCRDLSPAAAPDIGTVLDHVSREIANVCRADNPRFDTERFYSAAEVKRTQ